jgi:hypothetical protein
VEKRKRLLGPIYNKVTYERFSTFFVKMADPTPSLKNNKINEKESDFGLVEKLVSLRISEV